MEKYETPDARTLRIVGYRHTPQGYEELPLNEEGRLWLEAVGVWLGAREGRVVCYSRAGEEIADYGRLTRDIAAERARAEGSNRANIRRTISEYRPCCAGRPASAKSGTASSSLIISSHDF